MSPERAPSPRRALNSARCFGISGRFFCAIFRPRQALTFDDGVGRDRLQQPEKLRSRQRDASLGRLQAGACDVHEYGAAPPTDRAAGRCSPPPRRDRRARPCATCARRWPDRDAGPAGCSCDLQGHRTSRRTAGSATSATVSAAASAGPADRTPAAARKRRAALRRRPRACRPVARYGRGRTERRGRHRSARPAGNGPRGSSRRF